VYCVTNPYVPINLVRDPGALKENLSALGKTKALFGQTSEMSAFANARLLIRDGASIVGGVFGVIGVLIAVVNRRWWGAHSRATAVAELVGVPAALVLVQFVSLVAGKPGEFGRFAMLPDVALGLVGVVLALSTRMGRRWPGPTFATLVLLTGVQGWAYLAGFRADTRHGHTSRDLAAQRLEELWQRGARTLAVRADPAPYCLPPVDLTRWKLFLMPADGRVPDGEAPPDVIVFPVDEIARDRQVGGTPYVRSTVTGTHGGRMTRISWADKPFEIRTRRELIDPVQP
jgi:hypothetical protein